MEIENNEIKMYYITDPLTGYCVGVVIYYKNKLHHIYINGKIEHIS